MVETSISPWVQFIGIFLMIVVPLVLIWSAWSYVVEPLSLIFKSRGKKRDIFRWILLWGLGGIFLFAWFLVFYLPPKWAQIVILIAILLWIIGAGIYQYYKVKNEIKNGK